MISHLKLAQTTEEALITAFFQASVGNWHSERRYYTLPDGKTKEIISQLSVRFLEPGCGELLELQHLHQLPDDIPLICGSQVNWTSRDAITSRKQSEDSTVFGARGNVLYRDRGFATPKPVTATYYLPNSKTLCLRTEYNGSVFEEEIKLIGQRYRTRQTIISRAGEQQMIGQYLEKRIDV